MIRVLRALLALLILAGTAATAGAVTLQRISGPVMYIDSGDGLNSAYVGYEVTNTDGISYLDVWADIGGFTGGVVSVNEDGRVHLGAMAPGQSRTAFFFVRATGATGTTQSHTVTVYDGVPGGTVIGSGTYGITVEETIKANANKLTAVIHGPVPPVLGGLVTMTVTGETGSIGGSNILHYTPAAEDDWPADTYVLVETSITLTGGNTGVYTDSLHIVVTGSSNTAYTAVYKFRAEGSASGPTQVSPVGYIASGSQIKHTSNLDLSTIPPIYPAVAAARLLKSVSPGELFAPGTVTYTLAVTNQSSIDMFMDSFVDSLPTSPGAVTYVPGSSLFNGTGVLDPVLSGNVLAWTGAFAVPAMTTRSLTFQASVPGAGGAYLNRALVLIGPTQIDSTVTVGDDSPAEATVTVHAADLAVTKTVAPSVAAEGDTVVYTVVVSNAGPDAAAGVAVGDTLAAALNPAGAAATSGSYNGGTGVWTVGALAAGAADTLTITAILNPGTGGTIVLNTASAGVATPNDPVPGNNTASVALTVLAVAGLEVEKTVSAATSSEGDTVRYTIRAANLGPDDATGVAVADTLPTGVTLIAAGATRGSYAGGVWSLGALAAGAADTLFLDVVVDAGTTGTTIVNTAAISGNQIDLDPADNVATAAFTVTPSPSALSGVVFTDAGGGGGTANDGVPNGAEPGAAGVLVRLRSGGTVVDSTVTGAGGAYAFSIPAGAGYVTLVVEEVNPAGTVSTGGSPGTTGGTYDRTTDAVTFTFASGQAYTGVNFGDVPDNVFVADGAQNATAGTTVTYTHTFTAGTSGSVTFTSGNLATPAGPPWAHTVIRDLNCNGAVDPGDTTMAGPVPVDAGDVVCLIVSETVPVTATVGNQDLVTVTASFAYTGAAPPLAGTYQRTDLTVVDTAATGDLDLLKQVDRATAAPGDSITYILTFTNTGPLDITQVTVNDTIPGFSTFVAAAGATVPAGLSLLSLTAPPSGGTGLVQWVFTGILNPGASGEVRFVVRVD